jgi:hypothetical protein
MGMDEIDSFAHARVKQEEWPRDFDDLEPAYFTQPTYEWGASTSDKALVKPSISEGADQKFCLSPRASKAFVEVQMANGHERVI